MTLSLFMVDVKMISWLRERIAGQSLHVISFQQRGCQVCQPCTSEWYLQKQCACRSITFRPVQICSVEEWSWMYNHYHCVNEIVLGITRNRREITNCYSIWLEEFVLFSHSEMRTWTSLPFDISRSQSQSRNCDESCWWCFW